MFVYLMLPLVLKHPVEEQTGSTLVYQIDMPKYDEDIELHPQKDARIPLWRCPNQPNKQIQAPPPTALIKSWAIELFSNNDEPRTSIMSWFFRWYQAQGQRALASWPHPEEVMTLCVTQADQGRTSDLWSHTSFSDKEHKIGSSSSISRQKSLKSCNKTWLWIRNLFAIYFILYFWQFLWLFEGMFDMVMYLFLMPYLRFSTFCDFGLFFTCCLVLF